MLNTIKTSHNTLNVLSRTKFDEKYLHTEKVYNTGSNTVLQGVPGKSELFKCRLPSICTIFRR